MKIPNKEVKDAMILTLHRIDNVHPVNKLYNYLLKIKAREKTKGISLSAENLG